MSNSPSGRSAAPYISWALLFLCGAGLLQAWTLDKATWYIFEALIFILLILWSAGWVLGGPRAYWSHMFLPLLTIIAWGTLQLRMGWSVYAFATGTDTIRWGCYFSVFFLAVQSFDNAERERLFRRAFAVAAFAIAVVSVLQHFAGNGKILWLLQPPEVPDPGFGVFLNRDHYASFVALALPMAVIEARRSEPRWIFLICTGALYASVVACASRAGFVLVSLELVVLILTLRFASRSVVAAAILTAAFVLILGWESLYERLRIPDPYAGRREVAAATVEMIKANPWIGFGLGTWTEVYPAYAIKDFGTYGNAAHNDWLQWTAEGGVPVVACLALLLCGSIGIARQMPWAMGVPVVFLHCLIDFPMQGRFLPAVVFLTLGVATASGLRRETLEKHGPAKSPLKSGERNTPTPLRS